MAEISVDSSELNFEYLLVMIFSFICLLGIFHSAMIALRRPTKDSPQKSKSDKPKKASKTSEVLETSNPNPKINSDQDLEKGKILKYDTDCIIERTYCTMNATQSIIFVGVHTKVIISGNT